MQLKYFIPIILLIITIAFSGFTQEENFQTGESRFGVHLGSAWNAPYSLHNEISELGDIYVRLDISSDAYGWKQSKAGQQQVLCQECRDPSRSSGGCNAGEIYYCEPGSRSSVISSDNMNFHNGDYKLLAGVASSRYDKIPPKTIKPDYPTGNENIYEEYLHYLTQNLPKIKYWDIENEADYSLFWAGTSQNYANIVKLASQAIKADCPDCKTGISFASPNPGQEWFTAIGGVCNDFDYIDAHYYQTSLITTNQLDNWKTACPGKEFISTETGIPDFNVKAKSGNWAVLGGTRDNQARNLPKYLTTMFDAGYSKIFWYLIDHDFIRGQDDLWDHAGLLTMNHKKKPSFHAYKTMISKVDYFTSISKLGTGQYKYAFSNKNPVYILWCDAGTCSLPQEISGTVTVTDYLGQEETKQASEISLTDNPIFVE